MLYPLGYLSFILFTSAVLTIVYILLFIIDMPNSGAGGQDYFKRALKWPLFHISPIKSLLVAIIIIPYMVRCSCDDVNHFLLPVALPLGIHGDLAMQGAAVNDKDDEEQDTPIFETHHHLLHGDNKQYVNT